MAEDIVVRLREITFDGRKILQTRGATSILYCPSYSRLPHDAAAEIERLRRELAEANARTERVRPCD